MVHKKFLKIKNTDGAEKDSQMCQINANMNLEILGFANKIIISHHLAITIKLQSDCV